MIYAFVIVYRGKKHMQERKKIQMYYCLCPNSLFQGQKGEPGDITDVSWHDTTP